MSLYRDSAVVLRTWKLGEADRIVVLFTRGHGKVRGVAKGVRKTRSKFGARLEPGSHVAVQLYAGRELDIVTQAETVEHLPALRNDLDRLTRAASMLEVVDQVALEGEADPALFQLLTGALRALADQGGPLVVPAFFLKLLAVEGVGPVVEGCVDCGADSELVAIDFDQGGLLCEEHRRGLAVSDDAVRLVQDVLGGRLGNALNEPPSPVTAEVERLATAAVEHHLERRLRSLGLLDRR